MTQTTHKGTIFCTIGTCTCDMGSCDRCGRAMIAQSGICATCEATLKNERSGHQAFLEDTKALDLGKAHAAAMPKSGQLETEFDGYDYDSAGYDSRLDA